MAKGSIYRRSESHILEPRTPGLPAKEYDHKTTGPTRCGPPTPPASGQTLKRDVNQLPYETAPDLEASIVAFVSYNNYRSYHKALGNVTPSDLLRGKRDGILRRRREVKAQTIERRRQHKGPSGSLRDLNLTPVLSSPSSQSTLESKG